MELFLKITTTSLLLLALTIHAVHLQDFTESTDTPGKHVPLSWQRQKVLKIRALENEESSGESGDSSGTSSGTAEENMNATLESTTQHLIMPNETTLEPEYQDSNISTTTQLSTSDANVTDVDIQNNETALENAENSTNASNGTEVSTATPVPEKNATNATSVDSGEDITSTSTENNATATSPAPVPEGTTSTTQEASKGPTTSEAPTTSQPEITSSAPVTPDRANISDKGAGGTAERGFGSESEKRRKKGAWGAVLGTFVAIAVVGLVAYVILKKKHHKAFSHRKLEEDFPSDPVLRLDNSEPLDLNFGRAAYYNPGLQGDNIQMSPFPKN